MIWQAIAVLVGAQIVRDRLRTKKVPPRSAGPESQPPRELTQLEKLERRIDALIVLPDDPLQPSIPPEIPEHEIAPPADKVGDIREQFGNFRSPETGAGDSETGRTSRAAIEAPLVHPPPTVRTAPTSPLRTAEEFARGVIDRVPTFFHAVVPAILKDAAPAAPAAPAPGASPTTTVPQSATPQTPTALPAPAPTAPSGRIATSSGRVSGRLLL